MKEGVVTNDIVVETPVSRYLVIKVPVESLPISLKTGTSIVAEINTLCEKVKRQRLTDKLERFLKRAYEAEGNGNHFRSARAFALALFCEGKLSPEVTDPYAYVRQAMPVY